MRTIKFRALRDDMSDCNFYYGQLVYRVNEMTGKQYPAITNDGIYFTSCIEGTESQFTGLHDKNGKEIYEGDVVQFGTSETVVKYEETRNVEYGHGDCGETLFVGFNIGSSYGRDNELEVIGNIYENPEYGK